MSARTRSRTKLEAAGFVDIESQVTREQEIREVFEERVNEKLGQVDVALKTIQEEHKGFLNEQMNFSKKFHHAMTAQQEEQARVMNSIKEMQEKLHKVRILLLKLLVR